MKIKGRDFTILQSYVRRAVHATLAANSVEGRTATLSELEESHRIGGLAPKRMRWDAFHDASNIARCEHGVALVGDNVGMPGRTSIYAYANDDHIDTALRRIFLEMGAAWAASE